MTRLRWLGCVFPWLTTVPLLLLAKGLPWGIFLRLFGHSLFPMSDLNHMSKTLLYVLLVFDLLVLNAPDFVSLFIYLRMIGHFNKVNAVSEEIPTAELNENASEPYGGIWVGVVEVLTPNREEELANVPTSEAAQPEHEVGSVMRALKWHVLSSLLDTLMVLFMVWHCSPVGKTLAGVFQVVCSYWLPFLVIVSNCKRMGELGKCLGRIFC